MANVINSISIVTEQDEGPDLSYLGEFTDNPGKPGAILRPNASPREYKYFVPAMFGEETGNPDSPMQDMARMESYGESWWMVSVHAEAEIVVSGITQRIRSAGLYGIESDSDDMYFAEVERDELAGLRDVLLSLGFGGDEVRKAIENVKRNV